MNLSQLVNSLVFNNNLILNQHINSVSDTDLNFFISKRQFNFGFDTQSTLAEFINKTLLIGGFKQTRSQCSTNFDCRIYDDFGNFFNLH